MYKKQKVWSWFIYSIEGSDKTQAQINNGNTPHPTILCMPEWVHNFAR